MTQKMLYEGKAKQVFTTDNPDELLVYFKDDATAFNGEKKGTIGNKGVLNNKISVFFFNLLGEKGIPHHFVKMLSDREMLVKKLDILPVEVVVRNIAAGSLAKRIGWEEGRKLPSTVVELYYKNDELGDPLINDYHIKAMGLATPEQVETVEKYALQINEILSAFLKDKKIELIDFKLEFGIHKGQVLLGDEISPDTCRFWDSETKQKLDKDRFRRDLGNVEEAYQEVLRRLTGSKQ
ncbi:phosphoribosylaminoimidazolesuccinocarboxamide synthase [Sporomusa acidovorans]|uniref:Phosphoribosylaminoimidazole-succinocarboxamide synthase n=1 Tax=Sporomusa acidovorans (strain ATCC 49682 / DSM 3132 / Mol) TaxID=1123286 RepID=A0ABZ3J0G0_SPOA4|nr:phosphoribosylaminoimidazolesuccinocarboxamide synthase [Sporomusa acidovorans]OZC24233.1 phosphoribosylaminoimidazole-succinocarboxamide synthase [Sporomusa acidovorans DSM 3132]SDF56422.1 phosphoribosylaminoimidazole-succinocarboxamide synthase [Sporomusa acidovorans]